MRSNRAALRARIARQTRSALRLPRRISRAAGVALQLLYWTATLQLRAGMQRRRDARLIRNSDLFDRHHYLAQCAGDRRAEKDPVQHYLTVGAARGLAPSPLFDGAEYAERNRGGIARGENPLAHFLRARARARAGAPQRDEAARAPAATPWRLQPFRPASPGRSAVIVAPRPRGPGGRAAAVLARLHELGYAATWLDPLAPAPAAPGARGDAAGPPGLDVHLGLDACLAHLAAEGHAHRLAILSGAEAAFRLLAPLRAHARHAAVVVDRAGLLRQEDGDPARAPGDADVLGRMDEVTARCADVVWVAGEADREALLRAVPDARVELAADGPERAPDEGAIGRALAAARVAPPAPTPAPVTPRTPPPARPPRRVDRPRGNVLVAGVVLCDVENNGVEIVRELGRAEEWNVEQRWIALGRSPPPAAVAGAVAWQQRSRVAKFVLMNRLLGGLELDRYDYVLVSDDDIRLPDRFVDSYLGLVVRHDLALAQPARTHESFTDNFLVERLDGLTARRTRFVEIGPLFSMRRDAARLLTPFDETSPMGWALDFHWPLAIEGAGLRMGIVDATPVAHDLRKPVALYDNRDAAIAMQAFLAKRPHLSRHDAFSIVEAYP